uniref:Midasin n=1 Tax=Schizophyllum commune (strain H4-8 / FGSC 9210) TaxID=578458 RepID=D8PXL7_SCHCM
MAHRDPLAFNVRRQTQVLLEALPEDTTFATEIHSARSHTELFDALSRWLAAPSLTWRIATTFRPILVDLCARWLQGTQPTEEQLVALCFLVEIHEELFPVLYRVLSTKRFEHGPLSDISSSTERSRVHRLLLAYYRIMQINRELPGLQRWSLSHLSKLMWSENLDGGARLLAIRCYALQSGMGEAERERIEKQIFGEVGGPDCPLEYGVDEQGNTIITDGWLMPLRELQRVQNARNDMVAAPYDYFEGSEDSPVDETVLCPNVVNVNGILLVKDAGTPSPSSLIPTDSVNGALHEIATCMSLRLPILLTSPPSSGKSTILKHLAGLLHPTVKNQIVAIQLADTSLDARALLGSHVSSPTRPGTFEWRDGALVRAMRAGRWVVLEDIDRASAEVLGVLRPLVESLRVDKWIGGRARIAVPGRGEVIAHDAFALFATRSVRGSTTPPAFLGAHKWSEVVVPAPTAAEVHTIVEARFPRLRGAAANGFVALWDAVRALGPAASARDVGMRELEKLCARVERLLPRSYEPSDMMDVDNVGLPSLFPNPAFREDVYLEARDIFFGAGTTTAAARAQSDAIAIAIAEHLGIDAERREWVLKGRVPDFEVEKDVNGEAVGVRAGRTYLPAKAKESRTPLAPQRPFAMHRPAVILASRLATAVSLAEPLLLTGETGTGKTSVVTHLAGLLRRPLVTLNLSHQTESADLIGGFRPVDARIPGSELQGRFIELFGATFSRKKNEKFETEVRRAVAEGRWKRAAGLWKESVRLARDRIRKRREDEQGETSTPRKRRKVEKAPEELWAQFEHDVTDFEAQHVQGNGKFAFDFVEGPLVKALRAGDWVLLDEINLASPETLECVSSILQDATGSITLTEQGALEPVPRHPDFRLFACMNPATDVGKKDLPPHIRSRFTEIDVSPPDTDRDTLLSIIEKYIGAAAVADKPAIMHVADFYLAVRQMAEERRIADGSNKRPNYSMRTLARALMFAADAAPAYGLRRALWEGYIMAFTMVLDGESADLVTSAARTHILAGVRNVKSLLNREPVPPTSGEHLKFGPFYLEVGPLPVDGCMDYVMTPSVEAKLIALARIVTTRRFPVLIEGPTSSGKTSAVEYLARRTGHRFVRINNHEHTDIQEYLGSYVSDPITGKLAFRDGLLVRALRRGDWIVLDELNLAPTDVLEALNRLLDDNRELVIPETGEVVRPHPHFMLFATQNPAGLYGGRKALSRALRSRFLEAHFADVPRAELAEILCQRAAIAPSYAEKIVAVFRELQARRGAGRVFESREGFATLRDLFRWAGRGAIGYQALAEDGYMLLAERARRDDDRTVVKEVIQDVMKVKINQDALYDFDTPGRDMREFLGCTIPNDPNLVWTRAMRRLFVLTARALRFNEPVLLVGETGAGKTSVCQILAGATGQELCGVSCHQNTETADLIGGLRPVRNRHAIEAAILEDVQQVLAGLGMEETCDTVDALQARLVKILKSGGLDAEAAERVRGLVLRITSAKAIFEWRDGPLVESMKRGDVFLLDEISLADDSVLERLNSVLEPSRIIVLAERGGDAIDHSSVTASESFKLVATMNPGGDYGKKELSPALRNRFTEVWVPPVDDPRDLELIVDRLWKHDELKAWTKPLLAFADDLCRRVGDRTLVSLRDILAWVSFSNAVMDLGLQYAPSPPEIFHHAARMTFLDGLSALPQLSAYSRASLSEIKAGAIATLHALAPIADHVASAPSYDPAQYVQLGSFAIRRGHKPASSQAFNLRAPTTQDNAMRVVRACQLPKPILLEGSPGVGKTSLIAALADISGHHLCRINLSDQTDLIDLFGSDLPVEGGAPGEFAWKDAEFLKALQEGDWVLLDEMNLAPQAVLEGLNAVLDHRGSVYIPELGRSFVRHPNFRIFAAQNPLSQGGGRKGLPKSFVNRFTKVYVEEMTPSDLFLVCQHLYPDIDAGLLNAMIDFNAKLNEKLATDTTFARAGSPWEFNLRDVLRWGAVLKSQPPGTHPGALLRAIYLQRFRSRNDRDQARQIFDNVFGVDSASLETLAWSVSPEFARFGRFIAQRSNYASSTRPSRVLKMHLAALESVGQCVAQSWLGIITGERHCGKTELVKTMAAMTGNELTHISINHATDTMDILGGFEQVDELGQLKILAEDVLSHVDTYLRSNDGSHSSVVLCRDQLRTTIDRGAPADQIIHVASALQDSLASTDADIYILPLVQRLQDTARSPPSTGHFQWVDGPLVQAMKKGTWVLLDGANLCNPSVLDRLNSLCEPGGVLTLSERGLLDDQVEVVKPHARFRLFMTVDPQYGELSRAMRNRGIEICLSSGPLADDGDILQQYLRLPMGVTDAIGPVRNFDSIRRGIATSPTPRPPSLVSTGRALDQDSPLSSLSDWFCSPTASRQDARQQFVARSTIPTYALQLRRSDPSLAPPGEECTQKLLSSMREKYAIVWGVPLAYLVSQVSSRILSSKAFSNIYHFAHTRHRCRKPPRTVGNGMRTLGTRQRFAFGGKQPFPLPHGHAVNLTPAQISLETVSNFLSISQWLRSAIERDVFDYSAVQIASRWLSQAVDAGSPSFDALVGAVQELQDCVALQRGAGLEEFWSGFLVQIPAIDREAARRLAQMASELKVTAHALPGVADAQDFDLASLSRLVHEAENVCCFISRVIGREGLQSQMLQKEHDEHLHQSGVDLRPSAMLSQLNTLSHSSSMVERCFSSSILERRERTLENVLAGLSATCGQHLLDAVEQRLRAPLEAVVHQASPSLTEVGRCWMAVGWLVIDLFVPDTPVDPVAWYEYSRSFVSDKEAFLDAQIDLHSQLQYLSTGERGNAMIDYLVQQRNAMAGAMPKKISVQRKPDVGRVNAFWSEVHQFQNQLLSESRLSTLMDQLALGDPQAIHTEETLQGSMHGFYERLAGIYTDLQDLTGPLQFAILHLRLGLRLLALDGAQMTVRRSLGGIGAAVAFPSIKAATSLTDDVEAAPPSGLLSQRLLLSLSASDFEQATGMRNKQTLIKLESLFEQLTRLWLIERAKEADAEKAQSTLYRQHATTHEDLGDAEREAAEFNELFPQYGDDEEASTLSDHGPQTSNKSGNIGSAADLHISMFAALLDGNRRAGVEFRAARISFLSSLFEVEQHLPGTLDEQSTMLRLDILTEGITRLQQRDAGSQPYNFYTDHNISETKKAAEVVLAMKERISEVLQEWPEQMVLVNLLGRCDTLLALALDSPVAKVLSALEQLLVQSQDWEMYANRENTLKAHQQNLTALIVSWRRLELSCWQTLLDSQALSFAQAIPEWWFRLYDACVRGALDAASSEDALTEFLVKLLPLVDDFVRTSAVGQYAARLQLLRAFANYCGELSGVKTGLSRVALKRVRLLLCATLAYYSLSSARVQKSLEEQRRPLEKEVKDFIKLASWRDINVQALKESATRTHHQLYKIIRKFRDVLRQPVDAMLNPDFADNTGDDAAVPPPNNAQIPDGAEVSFPAHDPLTSSDHLRNIGQTYARFRSLVSSRITPFHTSLASSSLQDLSATIIETQKELAAETAPSDLPKEKREKFYKSLLVRKRKAWSDLLKELKRIGFRQNVKPDVLRLQADSRWIREQPMMPPVEGRDTQRAESYFLRLMGCLPAVRAAVPDHHADLSTRELQRGMGFLESVYEYALKARSEYVAYLLLLESYLPHRQSGEHASGVQRFDELVNLRKLENTLFGLASALGEVKDGILTYMSFEDTPVAPVDSLVAAFGEGAAQCSSQAAELRMVVDNIVLTPNSEERIALQRGAQVLSDMRNLLRRSSEEAPQMRYLFDPVCEWVDAQDVQPIDLLNTSAFLPADRSASIVDTLLINVQGILSQCDAARKTPQEDEDDDDFARRDLITLRALTSQLKLEKVSNAVQEAFANCDAPSDDFLRDVRRALPFLRAYETVVQVHIDTLAGWNKALFKLAYVLCILLRALATQGFCRPPDVEDDGEGGDNAGEATGGMGVGEGAGAENVSKEIEDESQVEGLRGEEAQDERRDQGGDEDDDAIEMNEDVGGALEDVPDRGDDEAESGDEEEQDLDEKIEDLDKSDPAAVDEKLWGDEKGPEDEGGQDDKIGDDRSKEQQQDESEVVAKEGGDKKEQKGEKGKDKEDAKDESAEQQPETKQAEDEAAPDQAEGEEQPSAEGAPMDEHVQDANTLELPDDIDMDDVEKEQDQDAEEDFGDEEMAMEEDQGPPESDGEVDDKEGGKEETKDGGDGEEDFPEDESMEPSMQVDDVQEESAADDDAPDGEAPTDQPDVTEGEGTDQITSEGRPDAGAASASTGQGASSAGQQGQQAGDQEINEEQAAEYQENADPSQTDQNAGSRAQGVRQGAEPSVGNPADDSLDPHRSLGDAMKEIQRRFDEILRSDKAQQPREAAPDAQADQVEYLQPEDADADMQALGPAGEEKAANLSELNVIQGDDLMDETTPMELDDIKQDEQHEQPAPSDRRPQAEELSSAPKQTHLEDAIMRYNPSADVPESVALVQKSEDHDGHEQKDSEERDAAVEAELREWVSSGHAENMVDHLWRRYEHLTHDLSYALCEQLRLILEPTLATRLRGDYRTGKRLNMKKIIPYIASDYTKDKIWLRRTRPSQREYQILIALDDSRSMAESHSVHLAYQTLALVTKALSRLEAGDVAVAKFGEGVDVLHGFDSGPFTDAAGAKVMDAFRFDQRATDVLKLVRASLNMLQAAREQRATGSATAGDLWQLEIIISDGMCQEHEQLRSVLRRAEEQRVMVVFIIIDSLQNPTAGTTAGQQPGSIVTMDKAEFKNVDGKMELQLQRYLDSFPFEYYVVLRDVEALPDVLSTTLKQFFERVTGSE